MPGGMGPSVTVTYADTANCNSNSAVTCTTITATYVFSFAVGYLGIGAQNLRATRQGCPLFLSSLFVQKKQHISRKT